MKSTTRSLRALKGVRPIVCLTAYDVSTARIADAGGADLILVGDSLGNVVLGLPDTVGVTLDMMIHHSAAVVRAKTEALVVGDEIWAVPGRGWPLTRYPLDSADPAAPAQPAATPAAPDEEPQSVEDRLKAEAEKKLKGLFGGN